MKFNSRRLLVAILFCFLIFGISGCKNKSTAVETGGPSASTNNSNGSTYQVNDKILYVDTSSRRIYGHVYTPKNVNKKMPIAIVSHGLGGSYQELENYAKDLANKGYLAYAFDFPGGATGGKSTRLSQTKMSIYTEEADLQGVIKALRKRSDVQKEGILLVGGSQGGVVTALTASQHPEHIKALVLMYPAFSITHDAQSMYSSVNEIPNKTDVFGFEVGKSYYQNLLDSDITKVATKFSGPVLIVHGTSDEVVPIKYSKQAAKNFPNATFKQINGGDHGFSGDYQAKAIKFMNDFIRQR